MLNFYCCLFDVSVMIEASAEDFLLQDFQKAVKVATKACQPIIRAIKDLQKTRGKPKREYEVPPHLQVQPEISETPLPADLVRDAASSLCEMKLRDIFQDSSLDKVARDTAMFAVRAETIEKLREFFPDWDSNILSECFGQVAKKIFRDLIFETQSRFVLS